MAPAFSLRYVGQMEFFDRPFNRITCAACQVAQRATWDVLFFSNRGYLFDAEEFAGYRSSRIGAIHFIDNLDSLRALTRRFDLAIFCNSATQEHASLFACRQRSMSDFVVTWTFDNHHAEARTLAANNLADAVIPAHRFAAAYMKTPSTVLGRHVPLGTSQWGRQRAAQMFRTYSGFARDDALHGTFLNHPTIGSHRAAFVRELQGALTNHALTVIDPGDDFRYFGANPAIRWLDWARHKTELVMPVNNDLPIRLFDSLLTGQVPIVPIWVSDLDSVFSPEVQQELPIIRVAERSAGAIQAAQSAAVLAYDKDGSVGAERRHLFALRHHHVVNRIEAICDQVVAMADPNNLMLDMDETSVGFVLNPTAR